VTHQQIKGLKMKEPKEILKEIEELGEFPKYPERKMGEKSREQFLKEADAYPIACKEFTAKKMALIQNLVESILDKKEESQYIDYIFCNRKTHRLPINFLPFNNDEVNNANDEIDWVATIDKIESNMSYYATFIDVGVGLLRSSIEQKKIIKEEQKKSLDDEQNK
jgi:hypothetical protein